jgi:hypothetical protein
MRLAGDADDVRRTYLYNFSSRNGEGSSTPSRRPLEDKESTKELLPGARTPFIRLHFATPAPFTAWQYIRMQQKRKLDDALFYGLFDIDETTDRIAG